MQNLSPIIYGQLEPRKYSDNNIKECIDDREIFDILQIINMYHKSYIFIINTRIRHRKLHLHNAY